MIYFKEEIEPFKDKEGMNVVPVPIELVGDEFIYCVNSKWENDIVNRGASLVTFDNSKIKELDFGQP